MKQTDHDVAHVLDAPGISCVALTPRIKQAITPLEAGAVIEVHTDDAASRIGVPAWCRLTGHHLVEVVEADADRTTFYICRKSP